MHTMVRRAALAAGGVLAVAALTSPALAAPPAGTSSPTTLATGEFTATVDFATLSLQPLPGGRCELTVDGVLTFTGTLSGAADGMTTAVVLAPCADVATTPPGTFRDIFGFEGDFVGTVDGVPTEGPLSYAGVSRPGGQIRAVIHLDGDEASAVLRADATIAVGGTYTGRAIDR